MFTAIRSIASAPSRILQFNSLAEATGIRKKGEVFVFIAITSVMVMLSREGAAQSPPFAWVNAAGGGGEDAGWSVTSDAAGSIYVAGFFSAGVSLGPINFTSQGGKDAFVGKIDTNGTWVWAKQFGGTGNDMAFGVAVDGSSNIYITGAFQNSVAFGGVTLGASGADDIFVVKLDPAGDVLWAKRAGGHSGWSNQGKSIKVDTSGNVFVSGYFGHNGLFGGFSLNASGNYDGFVTKLDGSGNFLWAQRTSSPGDTDTAFSIALDARGDVYVAGMFGATGTFGSIGLTGALAEGYLGKIDRNTGDFVWVKILGGNSQDYAFGVASDSAGNAYVTGLFNTQAVFGSTTLSGTGDEVFVTKLDTDGNFLWAAKAGGASGDRGNAIAVDGAGRVLVTGTFQGDATFGNTTLTSSGNNDVFLAMLDGGGNFLLAQKGGGGGEDTANSAAIDANGNLYVAGSYQGAATFGATTLSNAGSTDLFVAKLSASIGPPVVLLQPVDQIVTAKDNVTFIVLAIGAAPLSYQWQREGTNIFDGGNLSGTTAANLTITNAQGTNSGSYRVTVANNFGSVSSAPALLTVRPVNQPPSFTKGPNITVNEDAGPQSFANWATNIRPGPTSEPPQQVTFLVSNNNAGLFSVPPAISPLGAMTFTSAPNSNGVATITVRLRDDGGTLNGGSDTSPSQSFAITVLPVNDPPAFDLSTNVLVIRQNAGLQQMTNFAFRINPGPLNELDQTLTFRVETTNPQFFVVQPTLSTNGLLSFATATNVFGTLPLTVTLRDSGPTTLGGTNQSSPQTFSLAVAAVNQPPSFTKGANVTVNEDASAQSLANWATNIRSGPSNEPPQSLAFLLSNNNPGLFSTQPEISPTGVLTFTSAADSNGVAIVTARLQDGGGTADSGNDTSPAQTFIITVLPLNDAPMFSLSTNVLVLAEDAGLQRLTNFVASFAPGPPNEASQGASFTVTTTNPSFFIVQPTITPNGLLSFTTATNVNGTNLLTLILKDNGSTVPPNTNQSAPQTLNLVVTPANDPPFITGLRPLTMPEDTSTNLAFIVRDIDSDMGGVVVAAYSSNQALVPDNGLVVSGTGTNRLVSFTPLLNVNGTSSISLVAADEQFGRGTNSFLLTVTAVNDQPSFSLSTNMVRIAEDAGLLRLTNFLTNISPGPADEANQTLSFSVTTSDTRFFTVQPAITPAGVLSFSTAANANGTNFLTTILKDSGSTAFPSTNQSAPQTFSLVVTPVNDRPVISGLRPLTTPEDTVTNLTFIVTDIDTEISQVAVTARSSSQYVVPDSNLIVSGTGTNRTLSLTPRPNSNGTSTITLVAADDHLGRSTNTFVLTVLAVNDAPSFRLSTNVVFAAEDAGSQRITNFVVSINAGPPNEAIQALTFSVTTTNAPFFSVQPAISPGGILSFTTAPNVNGTNRLTVVLRDNGATSLGGTNQSSPQTFNLVATPVNDPPVITSLKPLTAPEDTATNLVFVVTDLDTEISRVIVTASSSNQDLVPDSNLSVSGATTNRTVSVLPRLNVNGTSTIRLVAVDDQAGRSTNSFLLTVQAVNDPPSFAFSTPVVTALEDAGLQRLTNFVVNISAGPPNEATQSLTFSVATSNPRFFSVQPTITPNGTLSFTSAPNVNGTNLLSVVLRDSGGALLGGTNQSAPQVFSLEVSPLNDKPVITGLKPLATLEDTATNLTFVVTDIDSDIGGVLVTASSSNQDLVPDASLVITGASTNRIVSITPQPNANGTSSIKLVATDDQFGRTTNSFPLTVQAVNDPPAFNLSTSQLIVPEDAGLMRLTNFVINISPGAANESVQALSFSITSTNTKFFATQPAITPAGVLSFAAAANTNGTNLLTVLLRDNGTTTLGGTNQSAPQTFSLVVSPVNDPPVISALKPVTTLEDTPTNLAFILTDIDSDVSGIVVTASSTNQTLVANSNLTVSGSGTNRLLTIASQPNANGHTTVTLLAADAQSGRTTNSFTLSVQSVNDAPSFTLMTNLVVVTDAQLASIPNFAANISAGPPDEIGQSLSFPLTITNTAFYVVPPSISSGGTLTFRPRSNTSGTNSVSVLLRDSGGTASGGTNQSAPRSFSIAVIPAGQIPITPLPGPASSVFQWVKKAGGAGPDVGTGVGVDSAGNSYVTGYFQGAVALGNLTLNSTEGTQDIFVAKFDSAGNPLWVRRAGGNGEDYAHGIAVDSAGNSYITGTFSGSASFEGATLSAAGSGDMFVAKYDNAGNLLWTKRAGGAGNEIGSALVIDAAGNSCVTGYFDGSAIFGNTTLTSSDGNQDIFVAKFDINGDVLWAKKAGGSGNDYGSAIAGDAAGNSYVSGYFEGSASFDGATLLSAGLEDGFVAKYDPAGNRLWVRRAGGPSTDITSAIGIDAAGNSYVTGYFHGAAGFGAAVLSTAGESDYNFFLAKYDNAGSLVWARQGGGKDIGSAGAAIVVDASGNSTATGHFVGSASFGNSALANTGAYDLFAVKYDNSGNLLWARQAGGTGSKSSRGIALDSTGHSLIAGEFTGASGFGDTTLASSGNSDVFIAKLVSSPASSSLVNGSFETGNFSGWATQELAQPYFPLAVRANGANNGFFSSLASDGSFSATHGFDGGGPGTIRMAQDVFVSPATPILNFDYRAAWDLVPYDATLARTFCVTVEPVGGGPAFTTTTILTAPPRTSTRDTGPLTGSVNLSQFAGDTVRISFDAYVPEFFTGPAFLQMDNVSFANYSRSGNRPPYANAGGPYSVAFGDSLTLDGTLSSDPNATSGNGIAAYYWDLDGDGLFDVTGGTVTLSGATLANMGFVQAGTYTIRLQVQDAGGASGFATASLVLTTSGAAPDCPPVLGLVSLWRGENDANDTVGTSHGALQNGAAFASGRVGQAFSFNGNTYVEVPNSEGVNFHGNMPMTVELWAYRAGSSPTMHFFGKRPGCGDIQYQMAFDGGGLAFGSYAGGVTTGIQMDLNRWYHLAATYDGAVFHFYIDGTLAGTGEGALGPAYSAPLRIARSGDCETFQGLIDEVAFYNRALSSTEIQTIYQLGVIGAGRNLPPIIVTQPQSQTVQAGTIASLSVIGNSSVPVSYQWSFNSMPLAGSTNATLSLTNLQAANAGDYRVLLSNCAGLTNSQIAILTVSPADAQPGWLIKTYKSDQVPSVRSLADADSLIVSQFVIASALMDKGDMVGFNSEEGTGHFNVNNPVPGINSLQATDDYAVQATGRLVVRTGGDYTFGLNTDDGARLRIDGNTVITDDVILPPHDSSYATVSLASGLHDIEWTWFNARGGLRGGGAVAEIFVARGTKSVFDSNFAVVGDDSMLDVISLPVVVPPPITTPPDSKEPPQFLWSKLVGGEGGLGGDASVAVDAEGNGYLAGSFSGVGNFGGASLVAASDENIFLAKYNIAGQLQWVRQAVGQFAVDGKNIAVDAAGNCFVTADFKGTAEFTTVSGSVSLTSPGDRDIFTAKYDPSGTVLWVKQAGGTLGQDSAGLAVDTKGDCYAGGNQSVAKYDSNGSLVWVKQLGASLDSIALDALDNVYLGGRFSGTITFGGFTLNDSTWEGSIYLAKLAADGSVLWAKSIANQRAGERELGLAVDPAGNSFLVGTFMESISFSGTSLQSRGRDDIFIAKYDAAGNFLWARQIGGGDTDYTHSLVADSHGNGYVTGKFTGTALFGTNAFVSKGTDNQGLAEGDLFVARFDRTGALDWVLQPNASTSREIGFDIAVNTLGHIYVTGTVSGTAVFGTDTLVGLGRESILISRLGIAETGGPVIVTQPQSRSVSTGSTATFTVTPSGTGPFTFQWKLNGSNLTDNSRISGSNSANLSVSNVQAGDAGTYTVVVSNSVGAVTSSGAALNVTAPTASAAPVLAQLPDVALDVNTMIHPGSADLRSFVTDPDSSSATMQFRIANLSAITTALGLSDGQNGGVSGIPVVTIGMDPDSGTFKTRPAQGGQDNTIHVHPRKDFSGSTTVIIEARDAEGHVSNQRAFTVTVSPPGAYTFTTLAGVAGIGSANGTGSAARFYSPQSVGVDGAGNVYVADLQNNAVRKITPEGVVSTLAGLAGSNGSGDGMGSAARFSLPSGVAVDSAGNVYVADSRNYTVRKITPDGMVSTLAGLAERSGSADGTGSAARFRYPSGLAVDSAGNVYVADYDDNTIRKITPDKVVSTIAGLPGSYGSADGTGSAARFRSPTGLAVDSAGNVYVADSSNYTIRKITPEGVVSTIAGLAGSHGFVDGAGTLARFDNPVGLTLDASGTILVAETSNFIIRKITPEGVVTTLAGSPWQSGSADGTGSAARFRSPIGLAADSAGNVYVADSGNNAIRKIAPGGVVSTLAGMANRGAADGAGSFARFNGPSDVAVDSVGTVYVVDSENQAIRKISAGGVVSTLAGGSTGISDGPGSTAQFYTPRGVAVDNVGNVYVGDTYNHLIRKITPGGVVSTLAGGGGGGYGSSDGIAGSAYFSYPYGLAVDSAGNVYVADSGNYTVRKITAGGVVSTLAGSAGQSGSADGTGSAARFNTPYDVAVDSAGNVYVADIFSSTIRKISPIGVVSTLAGLAGSGGHEDGTGSVARFGRPWGVTVDRTGNVYVGDFDRIRKITPSGVVTTLAGGSGSNGSEDGTGSAARFLGAWGVAVDSVGNLYVADNGNNTIRKGVPAIPPSLPNRPADLLVARRTYAANPVLLSGAYPPFRAVPNPPVIQIERRAGTVQMSVTTSSGRTYVLEYKDFLSESQWTPVSSVSGNGNMRVLKDPTAPASQRFYRVRVE